MTDLERKIADARNAATKVAELLASAAAAWRNGDAGTALRDAQSALAQALKSVEAQQARRRYADASTALQTARGKARDAIDRKDYDGALAAIAEGKKVLVNDRALLQLEQEATRDKQGEAQQGADRQRRLQLLQAAAQDCNGQNWKECEAKLEAVLDGADKAMKPEDAPAIDQAHKLLDKANAALANTSNSGQSADAVGHADKQRTVPTERSRGLGQARFRRRHRRHGASCSGVDGLPQILFGDAQRRARHGRIGKEGRGDAMGATGAAMRSERRLDQGDRRAATESRRRRRAPRPRLAQPTATPAFPPQPTLQRPGCRTIDGAYKGQLTVTKSVWRLSVDAYAFTVTMNFTVDKGGLSGEIEGRADCGPQVKIRAHCGTFSATITGTVDSGGGLKANYSGVFNWRQDDGAAKQRALSGDLAGQVGSGEGNGTFNLAEYNETYKEWGFRSSGSWSATSTAKPVVSQPTPTATLTSLLPTPTKTQAPNPPPIDSSANPGPVKQCEDSYTHAERQFLIYVGSKEAADAKAAIEAYKATALGPCRGQIDACNAEAQISRLYGYIGDSASADAASQAG